jgi:hypothetical protein
MSDAGMDLGTIVRELGFTPVEPHLAVGVVQGVPAGISPVGDDPPGLLMQWRCRTEGGSPQPVLALLAGTPRCG